MVRSPRRLSTGTESDSKSRRQVCLPCDDARGICAAAWRLRHGGGRSVVDRAAVAGRAGLARLLAKRLAHPRGAPADRDLARPSRYAFVSTARPDGAPGEHQDAIDLHDSSKTVTTSRSYLRAPTGRTRRSGRWKEQVRPVSYGRRFRQCAPRYSATLVGLLPRGVEC